MTTQSDESASQGYRFRLVLSALVTNAAGRARGRFEDAWTALADPVSIYPWRL